MYLVFTDENNCGHHIDDDKCVLWINRYHKINYNHTVIGNGILIIYKNNNGNIIESSTFKESMLSMMHGDSMYVSCILLHHNKNIGKFLSISEKYYLFDPRTIKKFNLIVDQGYIRCACHYGVVEFLEWWKNSGLPLKYDMSALTEASECGRVNVLEWWLNSGLPLKYDQYALNKASENGHVEVLTWWLNSNLPLKYDKYALHKASMNCHINVLEWWKNSGLELKYDTYALSLASENGHVEVLTWWLNSNLPLEYDVSVLQWVSKNGHVNVLEWFINNNFEVPLQYRFQVYYNKIKTYTKKCIGL
jgi:hypothetical protein